MGEMVVKGTKGIETSHFLTRTICFQCPPFSLRGSNSNRYHAVSRMIPEGGGGGGFALVFKTEKIPLYALSLSAHQEHSTKLRRDVNIVNPRKILIFHTFQHKRSLTRQSWPDAGICYFWQSLLFLRGKFVPSELGFLAPFELSLLLLPPFRTQLWNYEALFASC